MTMRAATRTPLAALLASAAALLAACGGSGRGLIPEANAGPLRADFEAVAQAAQSGNGSCTGTEAALGKTEKDFLALPASIDRGLRGRLQEGISNLRQRAMAMCAQPVPTVTSTTSTSTTPSTTPAQTTPTTTPTSTPTTATPSNEGGGTPAGEAEQEQGKGKEKGQGTGEDAGKGVGKEGAEGAEEGANSGGTSAGGASGGSGR